MKDCIFCKIIRMEMPIHKIWEALHSRVNQYFKKYEGYISSHDYKRADDKKLAELARKIRDKNS